MKSLRQYTCAILLVLATISFLVAYTHPAKRSLLWAPAPFSYSTTCLGDTVFFRIDADTSLIDSVRWTFGDPASGSFDTSYSKEKPWHIYTNLQVYTVQLITYSNNIADTSTQFIRAVTPTPSPFGEDTTLCVDSTLVLYAPNIPGASFMWQDSTTLDSLIVDTTGTYKLTVDGCQIKDSINVFYTPMPSIELGQDLVLCTGEVIMLDATAQNTDYLWSTGETSPTITASVTGQYWVEANAKGCGIFRDTINVQITGPEHPFSAGTDSLLCAGETIVLNASDPAATGYRWSTGARTPSINVSSRGDYWVFVNINNICEVVDTVSINYNSLGVVDLGNDTTICTGEFLVLTADYGTGQYTWQDGSTQATFYVDSAGTYYVHAQIGRCESTDSINVMYNDTLRVNLGPDSTICSSDIFYLQPNGAGLDYKWQDSSSVPQFLVTQPGIYAIVAQNVCGRATDSIMIQIEDCGCEVYFPSAFSPNGDGINDFFRPRVRCSLGEYRLSIFDRWGNLFFYTSQAGIGWNGKFKNDDAPIGTYTFMVQYTDDITQKVYQKSGSITLIR